MKKTIKLISSVLILVFVLSVFSACSLKSQSKLLIGKWMDSQQLNGYEFKENNICDITLVNFKIPVLNKTVNSTVTGSYTTKKTEDNKNLLTIIYTLYTKTFTKNYYYEVVDSTLILTDVESDNSEQTVYFKQASVVSTSQSS